MLCLDFDDVDDDYSTACVKISVAMPQCLYAIYPSIRHQLHGGKTRLKVMIPMREPIKFKTEFDKLTKRFEKLIPYEMDRGCYQMSHYQALCVQLEGLNDKDKPIVFDGELFLKFKTKQLELFR
jgi:hypothetical protein